MNNITHAVIKREKGWEGEVGPQEMSEGCVEILEQRELPGEEFGGSKQAQEVNLCWREGLCFQIQNKPVSKQTKDAVDPGFWI